MEVAGKEQAEKWNLQSTKEEECAGLTADWDGGPVCLYLEPSKCVNLQVQCVNVLACDTLHVHHFGNAAGNPARDVSRRHARAEAHVHLEIV